MATVLWSIAGASTAPAVRCELDTPEEGVYRIRILGGATGQAFFEHSMPDERGVIRSSTIIYQELRQRGWQDVRDRTREP